MSMKEKLNNNRYSVYFFTPSTSFVILKTEQTRGLYMKKFGMIFCLLMGILLVIAGSSKRKEAEPENNTEEVS